jgi:DNA-binding PadR family transcriptional regulator
LARGRDRRRRQLSFGQVYATLGRLARDGKVLIEAEPGAGPERKRYVITETGANEFETEAARPATSSCPSGKRRHCAARRSR